MRRRILPAIATPLFVLAALAAAFPSEAGAACITQGTQWWNNTDQLNQDPSIPRPLSGRIWRPAGAGTTPYLAVPMGGKLLNIYSLSSPGRPSQLVSADLWQGFLQTIQTYPFGFISVVDGQMIGYASFTTDGYVIFSFNPTTHAVSQLYKVDRPNTSGLSPAHLVMISGQLYLVGRIPTNADGETYMSGFSIYTVGSNGTPVRISGEDYGWSTNDNKHCFVVQTTDQAHTYAYVQISGGMDIWEITTPRSPVKVGTTQLHTPSYLVRDGSLPNLAYFVNTVGRSVEVVDLTNPSAPVDRGPVTVPTGGVGEAAAMGGLLYLPLNSTTATTGVAYSVTLPPTGGNASITTVPDQGGVLSRPPVTMESPQGATIYSSGSLFYVYREELGVGDTITVDPNCLDTTPNPSFTVTPSETTASCNLVAGGTPDVAGFAGDTFTIHDTSGGIWTSATLDIQQGGVSVGRLGLSSGTFPMTVAPGFQVLWTPPANQPRGDFTIVLDSFTPPATPSSASKSLTLCLPKAALGFGSGSSANMLVGETVNLTATSSQGHPDSGNGYDFFVTNADLSVDPITDTSGTASYVLPQDDGPYVFTVVAHYDFAAANDSACNGVPSQYLAANVYNSCTTLTVTAGFGVSSFEVLQNGQVVVASGTAGSILWDQPTTLRFTGRVATGNSPNFLWNIPNISSLSCSYGSWPYTGATCGPIPGQTWTAGTPVPLNMNLQVCPTPNAPGVDCTGTAVATLTAPTDTVTPLQVSAVLNANPSSVNVGQTVTFSVSNVVPGASSFSSMTLNLPSGATCNGQTTIPLCPSGCANGIHTAAVTFQNSSPSPAQYTAMLSGVTTIGGANVNLDNATVTVGPSTSGSCTVPVALAASPNPTTTGTTVTFTVTPGVTQGSSDVLTVDFGDNHTASISGTFCGGFYGPCNSTTHVYTVANTYSASVSGTLNGQSAATTTPLSVVVSQSTTTTVTITPSPNPAQVNTTVTFAFSPSLTKSTDTLTFSFGDGSLPSTVTGSFGTISSITHSFTTAKTYTVTASGSISGTTANGSTSVVIQGGTGPGGLTVVATPNPANVGDTVAVTFTPALSQTGDSVTLNLGDGSQPVVLTYPFGCSFGQCGTSHVYTTANSYLVSGSGRAGGKTVSGNVTLVVQSNCQSSSAPVANFTWSPTQPQVGQAVQFTDTSTGGAATSWSWNFGDGGQFGGGGTSTQQNPAYTYLAAKTYSVALQATNCRGTSQKVLQVTVAAACSQSAVPVASFTWGPTGPLAGFSEQQQPYAGQAVTFTDHSSNAPDGWQWCDFGELGPSCSGTPITTQNPTVTWTSPGARNVRLLAHNCIGWSAQQAVNSVNIYPDVRHVTADFSWSPDPPSVGQAITFTAAQDAAHGNPDTFLWTWDDTTNTDTGFSPQHTFTCAGTHKVTLTASRANYPSGAQSTFKSLSVGGTPCGPSAVMTVDNAKVNGLNGTSWRTDIWIFNPASTASQLWLQFLPINQSNANPFTAGPYSVPSKGAFAKDDILGWVGQELGANFTKTALRVTFQNDEDVAPMIVSRTYTPSLGGGTYGQYAPGVGVIVGSTPAYPIWITGLHNNGTKTGYRTNYSLLNLEGDSGVDPITFTLYDATGLPVKTVTQGLLPFGYIQDSIRNLFGAGFDTLSTPFSLKIEAPPGANIQAYGSVVDNLTGAPVLIPAGPPPSSPIYLPAVAHLNGKNGTVWRSDLQITNTDNIVHTWAIAYAPKASDPVSFTTVLKTLSPQQSVYMADVLNVVYSGLLTDAVATSGVIKIAPADGTLVYPAVQARTFNQTPNGTFGQNIVPMWAELGAAAGSQYTRLLLTGLASADIARTSLGFVNLSETSPVIFQAYFYGENGLPLNPLDYSYKPMPYNFSLPPGGWDQDQIENRFKNAFGNSLPANLSAISVEIFVTGGGPGSAYATVTDNITGDPTFIPAQAAP